MLLGQVAANLLESHQVGQDLTRMGTVGQGVDDRLLRPVRELEEVGMRAQARDDPVYVAVEHTCRVGDRLPKPELDVLPCQRSDGSAEPCDSNLERDPSAVRWPLEQHRDVL